MKISKKLAILAFVLCIILSNEVFAQLTASPYIIYNYKACDVELHYRVVDPSSGCAVQCFANNVIIAAGSNISISCVIAGNSDIQIVLIGAGGFPLNPIANVNFGAGLGGGGSWPCFPMLVQFDSGSVDPSAVVPCLGPAWSITVGPTSTIIN